MLVDHSLVRVDFDQGTARYRMLDTIRAIALEKMAESGEEPEIRQRHLAAYRAMTEQAEPYLTGYDQVAWNDRLERDHDNIRNALTWGVDHNIDAALAIAASIWRFWQIRGHLAEAGRWLERLLAQPGNDPSIRYRALHAAGGIAYWRGDLAEAHRWYGESLQVARDGDNRRNEAQALANYAAAHALRQELDGDEGEQVIELLRQARSIYANEQDTAGEAQVAWMMGDRLLSEGRCEGLPLVEWALEQFRRLDDPWWVAWAAFVRAYGLQQCDGALSEIAAGIAESLRFFAVVKDVSAITIHLAAIALVAFVAGEFALVARLLGAKNALVAASGTGLADQESLNLPGLDEAADRFGRAAFEAEMAAGAILTLDEAIEEASAFLASYPKRAIRE